MSKFQDESEFEKFFYDLADASLQIQDLAEWRQHQIKVVPKFINSIRLVANEQYSNLDHFLLELLQNADDNVYAAGREPTITLELSNDEFILFNNEVGFTAENLFAITYAAASTKIRAKTAATFIGEKGIGFKSVFAVADYVDIHSASYHFRLRNDEFIIPHPIPSKDVQGTEIRLHLKPGNAEIVKILSERLRTLCDSAQEFTLFLQKIEMLHIHDRISGVSGKVKTVRDRNEGYYIVESEGNIRTFVSYDYLETMSPEIVKSRFADMCEELEREIVFAVPLPEGDDVPRNGKLFCFLPTLVSTGTPIHIQVDAKTVTSREDIENFTSCPWNRTILQKLPEQMAEMYEQLAQDDRLKNRMPEYWPYDIETREVKNKDLKELITKTKSILKEKPIVLDRHGMCWSPGFVKMPQAYFNNLFYEDKYEQSLSKYLVNKNGKQNYNLEEFSEESIFTLVDPTWSNKYRSELTSIGVEMLDFQSGIEMLRMGPPENLDINDDAAVRSFLNVILEFEKELRNKEIYDYENGEKRKASILLKDLSIFPIVKGKKRLWGPLSTDTRLVRSNTPDLGGSFDISLVDPRFTYSPGGREQFDETRDFNKRFRDLLSDSLKLEAYNHSELVSRIYIRQLTDRRLDPSQTETRRKVNELWFGLYLRVWRAQTVIKREEGEGLWDKLIKEISQCLIPTRQPGSKEWKFVQLASAFIGPQFTSHTKNLEKVYSGSSAPIIRLEFLESLAQTRKAKREKRINWQDWYDFLVATGGKTGPYLVKEDLSKNDLYKEYCKPYTSMGYQDPNNPLGSAIILSIKQHYEYDSNNFSLTSESFTYRLDSNSSALIGKEDSDFLIQKISTLWKQLRDYRTEVNFVWGSRYKPRWATTNTLLLHEQVRHGLTLHTDKGLCNSLQCFEDNQLVRTILGNLVPYVKSQQRGYEPELLAHLGVRSDVTPVDLDKLIRSWYEETPPASRSSNAFLPYLKAYKQLCVLKDTAIAEMRSDVPLYCAGRDALLYYDEWIACISGDDFPAEIIQSLADIIEGTTEITSELVLNILFNLGDSLRDGKRLAQVFSDLGRVCRIEDQAEIKKAFDHRLNNGGLKFGNDKITFLCALPFLWDRRPLPENQDSNMIPIPNQYLGDEDIQLACRVIGWPLLSGKVLKVEPQGICKLHDVLLRRVFLTFQEIIKTLYVSQAHLADKLTKLKVFASMEEVSDHLAWTDQIKVCINSSYGGEHYFQVPYWFDGNHLYVRRDCQLNVVLPEFVDAWCGTTLQGFFTYIWNAKDAESKVYTSETSTETKDEWSPPEQKGEGGGSPYETGPKSEVNESIFDEPGDDPEPSEETDKNGKENKTSVGQENIRHRSRLYSYVPRKGKEHSDPDKEQKEAVRRKKVDQRGGERLRKFFDEKKISVTSVEADDCGYDFIVTLGAEEFYVELKSSESKWMGWESCLSPNEFKIALEKKDRYFLCIIDKVFDNDSQMYFIQDPANEVDGFLFDSPWKKFSVDMNKFVWKVKADQGILEE